jgi:DNA-binding response OmpR family regulator
MPKGDFLAVIAAAFDELVVLHRNAVQAAERARTAIATCERTGLLGRVCGGYMGCVTSGDRHWIDAERCMISWHGRRCDLGPSILFKLMQRLSRYPNHYCSYGVLMAEVWNRRCSNTTVRSAVKRLRRSLCESGMHDLADAIQGRHECYGLFLDDDDL